MMPGIDPRSEARKKRARIGAFITAGAAVASSALSGTRFSAWEWVPAREVLRRARLGPRRPG